MSGEASTFGNMFCMAEEPKKTLMVLFGIAKYHLWIPVLVMNEYRKNTVKLVEYSCVEYGLLLGVSVFHG